MWNALSGSVGNWLLPSHLLSAIILLGIILFPSRFKRLGRRLIVVGCIALVAVGVLPIGNWMIYALERRYPDWSPKNAPTAIIIVPGSNHSDLDPSTPYGRLGERAAMIAIFARFYPQTPIYDFLGASDDVGDQANDEPLEKLVRDFGLSSDQVKIERGQKGPAEIVQFCKERIAHGPGDRWLVVAPAVQLPLLINHFQRDNLPVEAHPIDRRISRRRDLYPSISVPGGVASFDIAVYEWARFLLDKK